MSDTTNTRVLAEGYSLNTGESDGETKSLTESHRIDLRPYSRYVVVSGDTWEELVSLRRIAEQLADAPTSRNAELRDVQQMARKLVTS